MIDRFICLDVEMPNGDGNRISAIGITVFEKGEVVQRIYSLINPETWFQPYVVELIGITPEMVEDKPNFAEYWDNIKDVLSSGLIVGHGAGNDLKALSCCLRYYKIDWQKELKYLCTVDACCKMYPDRHAYALNTICDEFGIELDHHNALSDSEACGRILLKCFEDGFDEEKFIRTFDLEKGRNKVIPKKINKTKQEIIDNAAQKVREDLFAFSTVRCKKNFLLNNPQFTEKEIIGVSQSVLYTYHKNNTTNNNIYLFTKKLPHDYHEENNLHAIIISNLKLCSQIIKQVDEFLPFVDNEETCLLLRPRLFAKKPKELNRKIREWIYSGEKYSVIFGLNTLKNYFIKTQYLNNFLEIVSMIKRDDDEVRRAVISFYAEALAKCPKRVSPFLGKGKIDDIKDEVVELALRKEGLKESFREIIEKRMLNKAVTV